MKVVLNQDVKGTGKKGQTVEVSDGYARNFLLRKNLAVEATQQNINNAAAKAVSYTHLDVYKRQVQAHRGRRRNCAGAV